MQDKVVVFAPHPDDEILGCGGTIAKKLHEGYSILIVFLTDGRNFLREFGILKPSPLELKEIRKEEAKRAAKILGVCQENLIFLDVEDGTLRENKTLALKKIMEVMRVSPKIVFFPQEREFHIDHRITNYLVKTAIEQMSFHTYEYQYSIAWQYPLNILPRLHPEGMQNLFISWLLKQNIIYEDISDFLSIKEAALKAYRSQFEILSQEQKRPSLKTSFSKTFLKDYEKFFVAK